VSLHGFDNFQCKLRELSNAAEKCVGKHQVSLDQLFHPLFMVENTGFGSISEFFDASPFKVSSQEDFESLDEVALDEFVRSKTRFESWHEMAQAAGAEWMARRFSEEIGS
jgi:hypothetical protein